MDELNSIVNSGAKLNLDYIIEDAVDDGVQDEIYEFFMKTTDDDVEKAYHKLKEEDDEITFDEVRLVRLKFLSEMAN